ncbi:MAG: globin [Bacteroidota bacterium]
MTFRLDNQFIKPLDLTIIESNYGSRPQVHPPDPNFLIHLREDGLRRLISDHYDLLVQSNIKNMFPQNEEELKKAKKHAADFFIQICGGHPYFNENHGKPMLSIRHQPFRIDANARKIWLQCYQKILPDLPVPAAYIQSFWDYLHVFSLWMINTPENHPMNNVV